MTDRHKILFLATLLTITGLLGLYETVYCHGLTVHAQSHGTASEEVPRGVIDGTNATFQLNFQPLPFASLHVFRNGLRLRRGVDYTLGGQFFESVIFTPGCSVSCIPQVGDGLLADYTY